jgi:hypothetical protein
MLFDERYGLRRARTIQQPVTVGRERVEVTGVGGERGAKVFFCDRIVLPLRDLAEQGSDPCARIGWCIRHERVGALERRPGR